MAKLKLKSEAGALLVGTILLAVAGMIVGVFLLYGLVSAINVNEYNEARSDLNVLHKEILERLGRSGCGTSLTDAGIDPKTIPDKSPILPSDPCATTIPPLQAEFESSLPFQLKNSTGSTLADYSSPTATTGKIGGFDIRATCTYRKNIKASDSSVTLTPCIAVYFAKLKSTVPEEFFKIPGKGDVLWSWHSLYTQPICCD